MAWLVALSAVTPGRRPLFTVRHLDVQTMEEESATSEDKKSKIYIAQYMWNPNVNAWCLSRCCGT